MAFSDSIFYDSRPLIMQEHQEQEQGQYQQRDSTSYPEVVPVENLKSNTLRHDDSWYTNQTQELNNVSHANRTLDESPLSQWNNGVSIGLRGLEKTSPRRFGLLVALCTFLFTALALSTGLGIPLAKCRNRLNPNNYAPLSPLKIETARTNAFCNDNGKLTRDSVFPTRKGNASFDLHCGLIFQQGLAGYDPKSNVSSSVGIVRNIAAIVAYSVEDCIQACASLNDETEVKDKESPKCQSVSFVSEMKSFVGQYDGNCFLKNATVLDLGQATVNAGAVSAEVHRLRKET